MTLQAGSAAASAQAS